jgi:predicted nuclease of predicted toxin-antitoxin system
VLALARREVRVLVTFDSDFGELIFLHGEPAPPAVVLLRLHPIVLEDVVVITRRALDADPEGAFVVTTLDGLRKRPLP